MSYDRYRDPEQSPGKADHECMRDTDQEQPTIQLGTSADYIPTHERKWKDIQLHVGISDLESCQ